MHTAIPKCYELNAAFGNVAPDTLFMLTAAHGPQVALAKNVFGQCHGVIEETLELSRSKTVVPTLDALGDMVTFLHGIPLKCGVSNARLAQLHLSSVCAATKPEMYDPMSIDWLVFTVCHEWEAFCGTSLVTLEGDDLCKVTEYGFAADTCMCPAAIVVPAALKFWARVTSMMFDFAVSNALDLGAVYDRVHTSNMTKLAPTHDQAVDAIKAYCDKYALQPSDFIVRSADQKNFAIYTARDLMLGQKPVPENKFLKCLDFKEPVFEGVYDKELVGQNQMMPTDFAPVGSPFRLTNANVYGCDDVLPPQCTGAGTIAMLYHARPVRRPGSNLARCTFNGESTSLLVNIRHDEGSDVVDIYERLNTDEGAYVATVQLPFKLFLLPIGQEALEAIVAHVGQHAPEGLHGTYTLTRVEACEQDWLYNVPANVNLVFANGAE